MKTNIEIIQKHFNTTFNSDCRLYLSTEQISHLMNLAREDELNHVKESINPEEGHNGFNKEMLNEEKQKWHDRKMVPDQLNINPDDFFQWCEIERLTGEVDPRRDLHFGENKIEGLILNVTRDVEPGHWNLSQN